MIPAVQEQPVMEAQPREELRREELPMLRRRQIAGPAGLAMLIAGGALLVRVAILMVQQQGAAHHTGLFTAATCVLAGVALVLVALPKIVPPEHGDTEPAPVTDG